MPQTRNLFTITYRDKNPKLAHDVVQTLLTIFVESATGTNRTDMENATPLPGAPDLVVSSSSCGRQRSAAPISAHATSISCRMPTSLVCPPSRRRATTCATSTASCRTRSSRATHCSRRWTTRRRCWSRKDTGGRGPGPGRTGETRLQEAEDQLKMLLLKDTEQHPDVIAQRKLIELLKTRQRSPHRSHCRDASEGGRCPPGHAETVGAQPGL